jgi:hypothetical protein
LPGNFFDDSNFGAFMDINAISIWFLSKQCAGSPGDSYPNGYLSTSTANTFQGSFNETLKDTALAYFNPTGGEPTNKSTLDNLTNKFATDYTNWRKLQFDYSFAGICRIAPSALVDEYEFSYGDFNNPCSTRIASFPYNEAIQELGHYDYQNDCTMIGGDLNYLDAKPWIYLFGPPAMCATATGGGLDISLYKFMEQDGRVFREYVSNYSL